MGTGRTAAPRARRAARRTALVAAVALALIAPRGLALAQAPPVTVRVALVRGESVVTVVVEGAAELVDLPAGRARRLARGAYRLQQGADGVDVAGVGRFSEVVRIRPLDGLLRIEEKRRAYRGLIEVRRAAAGLSVINELDVESYLRGVIRMEIDPAWPEEAVKAQAVAARTVAVSSLGRFEREGYDLRDTTDSQVYGGVTHEDPRATAAVDATRGIVVTYGGRPISAFFHADSGGRTESSEYVWGRPIPYLRGVPDPYAADSRHHEWETRLTPAALAEALRRGGVAVGAVRRLEVVRTSPSDRVLALRITGDRGAVEVAGTRFRSIVGDGIIRSTKFEIVDGSDDVVIHGYGWGHGVGLSQWGARGMAAQGRRFDEILRYYYTGVTLAEP